MRHDVGRDLKRRPSGSGISGIRKCGEAKITRRNGSMFSKTQLEPALLNNLKIGHITAKSTPWNGRRRDGLRPVPKSILGRHRGRPSPLKLRAFAYRCSRLTSSNGSIKNPCDFTTHLQRDCLYYGRTETQHHRKRSL